MQLLNRILLNAKRPERYDDRRNRPAATADPDNPGLFWSSFGPREPRFTQCLALPPCYLVSQVFAAA